MSECMHCQINELVQERVNRGEADIGELASCIVESLADLIMAAPENEHSKLMADALAHFGHTFLVRSGVIEEETSKATH